MIRLRRHFQANLVLPKSEIQYRTIMNRLSNIRVIQFADNAIKFNIESPKILEAVDIHFAQCMGEDQNLIAEYQVEVKEEAKFSIQKDGEEYSTDLTTEQVLFHLMQDGLTTLNGESKTSLIFHAAALSHRDRGLLLCGKSGSGKSTLAAWLTSDGYQYLTDEVTAYPLAGGEVSGFCRSLVLKNPSSIIWQRWLDGTDAKDYLKMSDGSAWITPTLLNPKSVQAHVVPRVILFPTYSAGAVFKTERLTSASTLFALLQCLVNARNFPDLGMAATRNLSQTVSAYRFTYSNIEQASEWIQQTITT